MNIYELPKEIEETLYKYYSCFDEETGELIVEEEIFNKIDQELKGLQNQKDELLNWYLKDRANRLADNVGLQAEIDRLQNRIKINKTKIARVENIVEYNFSELYKGKAIVFGNFTLNYSKSKVTVIEDESLIPEEYKKTEIITTVKIPKADIKKAIDSGKEVPGVKVEERKTLKIK